jgi:AraC-like DNA-binding protein
VPGVVSIPPDAVSPTGGAYLEHAPPVALAPYVECFWSRRESAVAPEVPRSHRVIPDGCVDVVLTLDGRVRAEAVGAMTHAVVFRDSSNTGYLGVRVRPGIAGVLFGLPAAELTDRSTSLDDVWHDSDVLRESLTSAPDTTARVRTLSAAVARKLLAAPAAPPAAVVAAARRIVVARGDLSVRALAAELGLTRQHLARLFADHVGLSPKMLARVVRARTVVERVRGRGDVDWVSVALDAGYYDQSHLIGELKALTGVSPGMWATGAA